MNAWQPRQPAFANVIVQPMGPFSQAGGLAHTINGDGNWQTELTMAFLWFIMDSRQVK